MNILVTAKATPDIDGLSMTYAYTEFLRNQNPEHHYLPQFISYKDTEISYLLEKLHINLNILSRETKFDEIYLVDMCEKLGWYNRIDQKLVTKVIDHRMFPDYDFYSNAQFQIEPVGAGATLIAEKFYFEGIVPTFEAAALLLCGIYNNCLHFKCDIATLRDTKMGNRLSELYDIKNLPREVITHSSEYTINHLESFLITDGKLKKDNGFFGGEGDYFLFQIETILSNRYLSNSNEVAKIIEKIGKAASRILLIQALDQDCTFIMTNNGRVKDYFKGLDIFAKEIAPNMIQLTTMKLRKQILQMILGK